MAEPYPPFSAATLSAHCYNPNMATLIDGYNLLHATDIFGPPGAGTVLHRTRQALLDFLAASLTKRDRSRTTIVFDAAGAPSSLPETLTHDEITVQFSRGYADADALLEELIEACRTPRSLTVVSGDHRVQRAARRRGAKYVDSDAWFAALRSKQRNRKSPNTASASKSVVEPTPNHVAYWLEKFSAPLPPDDERRPVKRRLKAPPKASPQAPAPPSEKRKSRAKKKSSGATEKPIFGEGIHPFPPGYAEDLLEGTE